ncbi:MAG: filamentous hemagglutinin N-terminal domain-containing protein, partial [Alphaproteobacteria bacterium]|nr:filamentous hemagglutinin N-terminal domain-containing protein [Alphaproteobacteria bacterium]
MTEATTRRGMQTCRRTTTSLSSTYRNSAAVLPWMLCASALITAGPAYAGSAVLPTGGQYVAGQGAISGSTNGLTINQSTSHGIINWQGFSIGAGNTVQFNNGSGATLNRVIGANISQIDGKLNATGSLYLINPQGIVIGPGGKVVTNGSFVASTRDVSNSAFMSGGAMSASGTSKGDVVNAGTITSKTGDAILVGRAVSNRGTVSAANGTAGMAAGNQILLQPAGSDPRIAIAGGTGDVTNTGTVKAAQVELNAAGGNVYALAGNNGGLISATGVKTVDGHIWLTAGGTTTVAGTVSATNADGTGGAVTVRGTDINVSGQINASANATGQAGGNVSVVATGNTTVSGTIKASGGGTIETSGHTLEVGGANVDAGQGGQWLLDPYDLTVDSSAATTIDTTLNAGTDVTLQTTATGTSGPGTANSSGNGDIFISSALSWSTSATLTLDAYRSVDINALVTVTGAGGVKIITNDGGGGGDYSFGLTSAGFTGSLNFTGGSGSGANLTINSTPYTILYSLSDLSGINTSANLSGNYALAGNLDDAGAAWTPLGTDGAGTLLNSGHGFTGTFTGLGHTISNISVNTGSAQAAGLFGYSANGGTLRDIGVVGGSVTGGSGVGALAGYAGDILNAFSTATVTGTAGGGDGAGGLAGQSSGTVSNVFATGTVTSSNASVGGLIGTAGGAVSNAFATGTVTATNSSANAGGLVGFNISSITNAYATGFVSVNGANAYAGGLVGQNFGNLTQVYSIGEVENFANLSNAGGSIGQNFAGPFTDAYYDTQYSAAANAIASNSGTGSPTGLSTSALQGSLPGSFSSTVWGTGTGLYPYLKAFYPSGVIAITGTAYTGALALADGLAHTVNAYVDGTAFYTGATLGSQGQYYLPLPSGTLTGSQNLLLVLQGEAANTYIAKASGSTSATLTVGVLAMSSDAASASAMLSGIATAEGSNSSSDFDYSGGSFHNSATVDITSSSATGFALDSVPSGAAGVSVKTTAGDISVTTPFTLSGGSGLSLDSFTSINIDAKVSIAGSGAVTLATDDGGSGGDYSFDLTSNGFAGSLDFGATNNGASLTINGTAYTLLYTLGDLSGINTDSALQLNYALATNLDDANAAWTPLGTDGAGNLKNSGNGFSGSFSGLGHTVSNLNVNTGSAQYAGLFGQAIGAIRDIGITGGTVTGGSFSGGLVGFIAAPVSDAFSTVTVSGNSSTGGLVGDTTRAISNAYATGSVTGSGNGVGGLVGVSGSTVSNSYATGAVSGNGRVGGLSGLAGNNVTNSYATGAVTATANSAGGLLGEIDSGSVSNSFAMGSVNGNGYVGGLIGLAFTPVSDTYATGAVHGSSNVGGLIGENAGGAVSNSYWDTLTSGTSTGIARTAGGGSGSATGLTTRQLQG